MKKFTKAKRTIIAGLTALMMALGNFPIFAEEPDVKSATVQYEVATDYEWNIHSTIDFGANAGANKTISRTGNQIEVLKNVIPKGKCLNIKVKGSGIDGAFTISNEGNEVLNYDVCDDKGNISANETILSVPSGTNTANMNINFKLNTKKGATEIAGSYNGQVIYTAEVGDPCLKSGTLLNIEGAKYMVLEQKENSNALVIKYEDIGERSFNSNSRSDRQNPNTYEGSEIDNYLENDWYNSLSSIMKAAVEPINIKQSSYSNFKDFNSKQETGYNGQIYNTINRHVFLPSVNEIEKVTDLNKSSSIYGFVGHNKNMWTRDSIQNSNEQIEAFYGNYRVSGAATYKSNAKAGVRPTFVIDLSKVDYTVTGYVIYK